MGTLLIGLAALSLMNIGLGLVIVLGALVRLARRP